MRRVIVVALLFSAACDRPAATRPTPTSVSDNYQLKPGPQALEVGGYGFSNVPDLPACTPIGSPHDGTFVLTPLTLTREGGEWVARTPPGVSGRLELRFHESGQSLFGRLVSGTISGVALHHDSIIPYPPRDVRVLLAGADGTGPAQVEGTIPASSSHPRGRITGTIGFSDRAGFDRSTCSVVEWSLQPAAGVFLGTP
jgi:hypothetical protein